MILKADMKRELQSKLRKRAADRRSSRRTNVSGLWAARPEATESAAAKEKEKQNKEPGNPRY